MFLLLQEITSLLVSYSMAAVTLRLEAISAFLYFVSFVHEGCRDPRISCIWECHWTIVGCNAGCWKMRFNSCRKIRQRRRKNIFSRLNIWRRKTADSRGWLLRFLLLCHLKIMIILIITSLMSSKQSHCKSSHSLFGESECRIVVSSGHRPLDCAILLTYY